mmetsp:Transcript_50786/g.108224  ORF Transcript_50786/g.108224 Transcript_50786/m.108224 type:complete len:219 (+) Transcript_50786:293-949(+)
MLLMPLEFACLLLGCELIKVEWKKDGTVHRITIDDRKWKNFLRLYGLRSLDGREGLVDITNGKVYEDALEMPKRGTSIPDDRGNQKEFWMVRIGWVGEGQIATNAQKEMNSLTEPPESNVALSLAQRRLHIGIHSLILDIQFDEDLNKQAKAIRDWMLKPPQFHKEAPASPNPRPPKKGRVGSPEKGPKPTPPPPANPVENDVLCGKWNRSLSSCGSY